DEFRTSIASSKPVLFDMDRAHGLYLTLLSPLQYMGGRHHLILVPTGALTALPFSLLVTKEPPKEPITLSTLARYRDIAWLARDHAITVVPSVASLKALRGTATGKPGVKPLVGFGDPVFGSDQTAGAQRTAKVRIAAKTRAYTDFWKGAGVDRDRL